MKYLKIVKNIITTCLILLCTASLSAEKFIISPDGSDIFCTLRTLGPTESLHKIGDFLQPTCNQLMGVAVTLENNSPDTIVLRKDAYLTECEKFFVSKDLITELQIKALSAENANTMTDLVGSAVLTGIAGYLGYFGFKSFTGDNHAGFNRREPRGSWKGAVFCSALLEGISLFVGGQSIVRALTLKPKIRNKIKDTSFQAKCYSEDKRIKVVFSKQAEYYKIPPSCTLHDLFFVNLKRAKRTVFKKIEPTLDFEVIE